MEKLSIKEKVNLVKRARKHYKNSIARGRNIGLCSSFICSHPDYMTLSSVDILHEDILPELLAYKPIDKEVTGYWWLKCDTKSRLRVLDELEAQLISKPPWYAKLQLKVKQLWQRN